MSKDVKFLVLVFGSLAGLIVVAIVGLIALFALSISHRVSGSSAKSNAAAAAKIATFSLPPGYHYQLAMDMFFVNMVMIGSDEHRHFTIELQGMSLKPGANDDGQLGASMQQGLAAGCTSKTLAGHERLQTASGKTVSLDVLNCRNASGAANVIELGQIPSKYPIATIMALGTPQDFDRAALDELVRSIR